MKARIAVLPGDGIGPEVTVEAVRVLEAVADQRGHEFQFETHPVGGASLDATGTPLDSKTLNACQRADAILLGAVGGPQWEQLPVSLRPEQGLLTLRKSLGLFANLRPVRPHPSLAEASPLKPERLKGVNLVVVRELTGGLYFGHPKERRTVSGTVRAIDTLEYTEDEIRRIVRLAFELARHRKRHVTSVDKANVLESSRLWQEIAQEEAEQHPDVHFDRLLVDACAMRLVQAPSFFDVVVTENMFGDILTDEAAVLVGSIGLLPSASLGQSGPGLYEPVHGSAPDIAGQGVANPIGAILSAALLLRHSLHLEEEARAIEEAVDRALEKGHRTQDLQGALGTQEMANAVLAELSIYASARSLP